MDNATNRYVQIGNVCAQWSSLEYMLAVGIWLMIDVDEDIGKIVTGNLDAKQRATMAKALAWKLNAPFAFKTAIREVLDQMRSDLIDRRNEAVHGIHFGDESSTTISIELHRGKGGRDPRELTNESLAELGRAIHSAAAKMAQANIQLAEERKHRIEHAKEFVEYAQQVLDPELRN